jgi:putative MATE family efflux protein
MDMDESKEQASAKGGQSGDSLYRSLANLAVPLILANLVQQLYNMTDVFFLGRYKSSLALSAAGISMQISWMLIYMFVGLSVGASIVTAQSFGAKSADRLTKAVHTTISLSIFSGVILTIFGVILTPVLLGIINTPEEVMPEAKSYLRVHFLSMLPFIGYTMGSALLRGVGDTKTSMYAISISLVVKFVLVYILVKVLHGGVVHAASATICAQAAACAVVIRRLLKSTGPHRLEPKKLRVDKPTLWKIVTLGVPMGLQSLAQYLANVYFISQVNLYGPDAMAGLITFTRFEGVLYMPVDGFSLAASTLSGQNIGARNYNNIHRITRQTAYLCLGLCLISSIAVLLLGPMVIGLFNPTNARAVQVGTLLIIFIVPAYFLYAINQTFSGVIRGTGETRAPMLIILFFTCGVRIIWINLVHENLTLLALTYIISWFCTFVAFLVYYRKGNWLKRYYT